ncbi:MAG TPA: lipoyl(octanoyl) transferase LipB [Gemmatimonadota bacterium]|nr:lipoyl(octanoyl) transferase LipB [Gemmatimonadota bacterium]
MPTLLEEAPPRPATAVRRIGRIGYRDSWALQREAMVERRAGRIPDTLLLLEHPPVITLGRAGSEDHLLGSDRELAERGVELVPTDRGGDITFHGPGQVVGYSIVDLDRRGRDLHRYLRDLESVLLLALAEFGIRAGRAPGLTGVWVGDAKVAAIGIRVSRWIAHHGFALNVDTDLSYFDLIVPCGIADRGVTSMAALAGGPFDRRGVEDALARAFDSVFGGDSAGQEGAR